MPRVNEFGCFDDCFNYLAAYFMQHGKTLYSEIFFNHQMLPAFMSYAVQTLSRPENIYELLLRHRQTLLLFSLAMNLLLLFRFGLPAVGFMLFYEFSKFYVFGDRFLAEGFIVYACVYLVGIIWSKYQLKKIYAFDYIFAGIFAWFIIFMREPYVPLALFLYLALLWGQPFVLPKKMSLILFFLLSAGTILAMPLQDYYFNVVTVNQQTIFQSESQSSDLAGVGLARVFLYPIIIFLEGEWNLFHKLLAVFSALYISIAAYLAFIKKRYILIGILFIGLGLANLRIVTPGRVYYEAFHMIPWYGVFLFTTFLFLQQLYKTQKSMTYIIYGGLIGLFCYFIFSPSSFIQSPPDPHTSLLTNFGRELQAGETVKALSTPGDFLFLDGADDIVYWHANMMSQYYYSWYTSVMPSFPVYAEERIRMFKETPPDFYYGSCPGEKSRDRIMPDDIRPQYVQLYADGGQTCLYIHKTKISEITNEQWEKAKAFRYELPEDR